MPFAVLEMITRGKGALVNLAVCGMINPHMDSREWALAMALGETLQLLDDYAGLNRDNGNGVTPLSR